MGTESVVLLLQNLHFTARESFLPKIVETREKVQDISREWNIFLAKKYIRNLKIFKRNIPRPKIFFNQSFAQIKVND